MNDAQDILSRAMKEGFNVLLVGPHGVGKTQMVCEEVRRQGLTLKYYSSATLDPWADLVGIPIPVDGDDNKSRKHLEFVRPADVDAAQIVFFDEINRSHPKVQNAVLEMVQFKTINGAPLRNLRMVWAAINPPGGIYTVSELDPVLLDRFQLHVLVSAAPSVEYYRSRAGIPEHIAKALVLWWRRDLSAELQQQISPRRLEYLGQVLAKGLPMEFAIPTSVRVPLQNLVRRINGVGVLPFAITRETLVSHQDQILAEMEDKAEVHLLVADELLASPEVLPRCVPLYLALSPEFQAKLVNDSDVRTALKNLAHNGGRNGSRDLRAWPTGCWRWAPWMEEGDDAADCDDPRHPDPRADRRAAL